MHRQWLGDAYTYSHRALIHAIAPPEEWLIHPMLFFAKAGEEPGGGLDINDYAQFLGLENAIVLPSNQRVRAQLVSDVAAYPNRHLFLDPDTGIRLSRNQRPGKQHITMEELKKIATERDDSVVLVFDQSYHRETKTAREKIEAKLQLLTGLGIVGGAVIVRESPCTCYVMVSTNKSDAVNRSILKIRNVLPIPESRLVIPPKHDTARKPCCC